MKRRVFLHQRQFSSPKRKGRIKITNWHLVNASKRSLLQERPQFESNPVHLEVLEDDLRVDLLVNVLLKQFSLLLLDPVGDPRLCGVGHEPQLEVFGARCVVALAELGGVAGVRLVAVQGQDTLEETFIQ